MTHNMTLNEYIKTLRCVEKISEVSYSFVYDYCWCCGTVTSTLEEDILQIVPIKIEHNIGKGSGKPVLLKFKK